MTDDILKEALDGFRIAEEAEADNRTNAIDDIRFARLGQQWPEAVAKQREKEGRPCLTVNKLAPVIRQVVNDARQNRPAIKVNPADSKADPETADVLSGMIRNIEQSSDADVAYDTAVEHAVSGGFGYWRINLDYAMAALSEDDMRSVGAAAFEKDICIRRVANQFSVYGDPYSQAADSSDWNTSWVTETLTKDQFKLKYKGAEVSDFDGPEWSKAESPWKEGESVQIAEYWKRDEIIKKAVAVQLGMSEDGQPGDVVVMYMDEFEKSQELIAAAGGQVIGSPRDVRCYAVKQHIMSGVEVLESNDWIGSYIPIVPVYGDEVNDEGKRWFRSLICDAKDSNRMFNYWRTTATEVIALAPRAPFIGRKGTFETDAAKWATANSASHAYLEYDNEMPQRQPFAGIPAGMLQEALNAADDIKAITGIYDASLGARSNETSGVAIRQRQREGDVSTFHFIDNLSRAIRHTGRILIDLIPKVYADERMVRILGEDGVPDTVTINSERPEMEGQDEAKEQLRVHDVRVGRYDVAVSTGPSFTTRREEARIEMTELIRAFPDAAPIIGDIVAKNFDWPGADEIAERFKKMLPPQLQEEQGGLPPEVETQMQQMAEALQAMGQKLQEAEGSKDMEARKLAIEEYKAETERMTAVAPAMGPDQIQAIVLQTLNDLASEGQITEMDLAA